MHSTTSFVKKIQNFISLIMSFVLIGGFTMARGTPDDGQNLSSSPATQVFDLGEQATRLLMGGGANSRSGRWLWATGFESGLGEVYASSANGGVVALTENIVYMGKKSAKITTTAVIGSQGRVQKNIFSPSQPDSVSNKIGLESMIEFTLFNGPCQLNFVIVAPTSNLAQYASYRIRINIITDNNIFIQYQNNVGAYVNFVDLSTYGLAGNNLVYHYMKLIVDANQKRYSRLIFDNTSYDMASLSPQVIAGLVPSITGDILFENRSNVVTPSIQLDNFIITGDEP